MLKLKRAALYIRVSTDEQARHGLSLGEQRADLERYAREHHYAVVDIYADEGNTARKALSKRKELQRLLGDVRAGRIDIIIFKCLDRWFRSVKDYYKVQEVLDAHGVDWECTQERYNTTTTNGRLMLNIKLSVAQNESDQTSDRIKYINEGKLRRHEVLTGKHCYGYVIKDKHYVPEPHQAEVVRFVYARLIAGDSCRLIAQRIYDIYGDVVSVRQVRCITENPVYIGTYHGIENYHEPIVSREDYNRVREIMARHPKPVRSDYVYLFTGKLVCPSCGGILVGHKYVTKRSCVAIYFCGRRYISGKVAGPDVCHFGGGIRETVIERWLVANLADLLHRHIMSFHIGKSAGGPSPEQKKKTIEGKLSRLKELYIDGLIDKTEFKRRAAQYQNDLDKLSVEPMHAGRPSPAVMDAYNHIDGFRDTYRALDRAHKREFWQSIIGRIELGKRPQHRGEQYRDFRVTLA